MNVRSISKIVQSQEFISKYRRVKKIFILLLVMGKGIFNGISGMYNFKKKSLMATCMTRRL